MTDSMAILVGSADGYRCCIESVNYSSDDVAKREDLRWANMVGLAFKFY